MRDKEDESNVNTRAKCAHSTNCALLNLLLLHGDCRKEASDCLNRFSYHRDNLELVYFLMRRRRFNLSLRP